jgi:hypothetical protein
VRLSAIQVAQEVLAYNTLVVAWPKLKELTRQQAAWQEILFKNKGKFVD